MRMLKLTATTAQSLFLPDGFANHRQTNRQQYPRGFSLLTEQAMLLPTPDQQNSTSKHGIQSDLWYRGHGSVHQHAAVTKNCFCNRCWPGLISLVQCGTNMLLVLT